MSRTQHRVVLTPAERRHLQHLVRQSTVSHFTYQRARILLAADHRTEGPAPTDAGVARTVGVSTRTVARVRARWADAGVAATLRPADRGTRGRSRFDTATQARIVQLACSPPPPGHARWTVRMLAHQVIELAIVDQIAPESVRQVLKKTASSPG